MKSTGNKITYQKSCENLQAIKLHTKNHVKSTGNQIAYHKTSRSHRQSNYLPQNAYKNFKEMSNTHIHVSNYIIQAIKLHTYQKRQWKSTRQKRKDKEKKKKKPSTTHTQRPLIATRQHNHDTTEEDVTQEEVQRRRRG